LTDSGQVIIYAVRIRLPLLTKLCISH